MADFKLNRILVAVADPLGRLEEAACGGVSLGAFPDGGHHRPLQCNTLLRLDGLLHAGSEHFTRLEAEQHRRP